MKLKMNWNENASKFFFRKPVEMERELKWMLRLYVKTTPMKIKID